MTGSSPCSRSIRLPVKMFGISCVFEKESRAKVHHGAVFFGKFVKIKFSECISVTFFQTREQTRIRLDSWDQQFLHVFVLFLHRSQPFSRCVDTGILRRAASCPRTVHSAALCGMQRYSFHLDATVSLLSGFLVVLGKAIGHPMPRLGFRGLGHRTASSLEQRSVVSFCDVALQPARKLDSLSGVVSMTFETSSIECLFFCHLMSRRNQCGND